MAYEPRMINSTISIAESLKKIARSLAMIESMFSDSLDNKEDNRQLKQDFKELLSAFAYEKVSPLPTRESTNFRDLLERYGFRHYP